LIKFRTNKIKRVITMPAIIGGPLHIVNIGGTGVVNFEASATISPISTGKTFSGCGCFDTAPWVISTNGLSSTGVLDTSLVDQAVAGNN
jgi:spore germination protein PF